MREDILSLIKSDGPVSVLSLMSVTGMSDKAVRTAIDHLRTLGEPICHGQRGFWFKPGFVPPDLPYGRWKCEPDANTAWKSAPSTVPPATRAAMPSREGALRFKTPPIPDRIKELRCPPFTNIFELGLGNRNLFGTETLLGDWDGPLLIVAKDFAPVDAVLSVAAKVTDPALAYRHNDGDGRYGRVGYSTNTRLLRYLYGSAGAAMINGGDNLRCGALYISACFFLKPGSFTSSDLGVWNPGRPVFDHSQSVLRFVLQSMPNLRAIACLGKDALRLVRTTVSASDVQVGELRHPSRGAHLEHEAAWVDFLKRAELRSIDGKMVRSAMNAN